ncbi:pheromone processing endoprotease [Ceratobasidium sp. 395]|nr:pheromone processing endoprotease [Ceratobasidium sp. 395]
MEYGHHWEGCDCFIVGQGLDYESGVLSPNILKSLLKGRTTTPTTNLCLGSNYRTTSVVHAVLGRCSLRGTISAAQELRTMPKLPGVRILSGPRFNADKAASLDHAYQKNQTYSCSPGSLGGGRSTEAPSSLIEKAVVNGVREGRGGKGSVPVFASGNGAGSDDQCNFDGYTNSVFSVTVTLVNIKGLYPHCCKSCAANMTVAYSSGGGQNIIRKRDVSQAMEALVALLLSPSASLHSLSNLDQGSPGMALNTSAYAQPHRSTRRIQTGNTPPSDDPTATSTVTTAARTSRQDVEPGQTTSVPGAQANRVGRRRHITCVLGRDEGWNVDSGGVKSEAEVTADMMRERNFEKLEHITVKGWTAHTKRGDVKVELVSPKGIKSVPAAKRRYDQDEKGFRGGAPKPTEHLPGDHDTAEGEAHKPSFSTTSPATGNNSTSTASVQPAPDEGYFSYMTDLPNSQTWLFAALGAAVIFVIGAGVWMYRRRRSRMRDYAALGGDDVPMSQVGGAAGGIRELYDAFGELSDGESEADEEAALRGQQDKGRQERYVDDVLEGEEAGHGSGHGGGGTRSPEENSWEHASQMLTR